MPEKILSLVCDLFLIGNDVVHVSNNAGVGFKFFFETLFGFVQLEVQL